VKPEQLTYFRQIPSSARILVSRGDRVEADTVVARVEALPGRMARVNAASTIGVEPRDLLQRMVKKAGDHVKVGDTLAARSEFFDRRAVRCPVEGVVSSISRNLGNVYIREIVDLGEGTGPVTVHAARELRIPPRELQHNRAPGVKEGALVAKGQVLAARDRDLPKHKTVVSPIYGRIREIDLEEGTITIIPAFPSPDVKAYIRGRVTAVIPDAGIEIRGKGVRLEGVWGLGGEAFGRLHVVRGDLDTAVQADQGAILAVQGTASHDALLAARDSGVAGIILGYMPSETVLSLVGDHSNLGITGDDDVPYPIVVMEGFQPIPMREQVFSALLRHGRGTVSIRGVTHIRAGVIRPEVILHSTHDRGEVM
jgi:hypothetical protein